MTITSKSPVRVKLERDLIEKNGYVAIGFDIRLNTVGRDYSLYTNTFDPTPMDGQSPLMHEIVTRLMGDRSGVGSISVSPFNLILRSVSGAVTAAEIMALVKVGVEAAGFEYVEV